MWGLTSDVGEDLRFGEIEVWIELESRLEGGLRADPTDCDDHCRSHDSNRCERHRKEHAHLPSPTTSSSPHDQRSVLEIVDESATVIGMTELEESLGLDLAHAFACHIERAGHLLERARLAVVEPKTHSE